MSNKVQTAKDFYQAFSEGNRNFVEDHLSEDFTFSALPDPFLDRAGYFERCWPGAGKGQEFEFMRLVESGDEVIVTYESKIGDTRGRNTEVLTFDGNKVKRAEVYFGWAI